MTVQPEPAQPQKTAIPGAVCFNHGRRRRKTRTAVLFVILPPRKKLWRGFVT